MSTPPAISRVRVRYAETDKMGIVYYANYLVWFEVGRTDLLREHGWSYREMETDGLSLPVVEAACAYRRPALYDDELEVRTTGALLSPVRVRFDYRVVRPADAATVAYRLLKPSANLHQKLVADRMAQRVIDQLETVEIDQQQRATALIFPLPHHCFFQQLTHQQAVGEAGQRIGTGGANRIIAVKPCLSDVGSNAAPADQLRLFIQNRLAGN